MRELGSSPKRNTALSVDCTRKGARYGSEGRGRGSVVKCKVSSIL